MGMQTEYAKLLTSYVPGTIYGLRTVVTIPTETWIGVGQETKGNGFLDAYLSLDRVKGSSTYHYECGLSQSFGHATHWGLYNKSGDSKWHYMFTGPNGASGGGNYDFVPGQQVPIELSINSSGGLDFIVNYVKVHTFNDGGLTTTDGITNARLVIGACEQDFLSTSEIPSNPLTAWGTLTTQIACNNYAYRNSTGSWVLINPGTNGVNRVYWPPGYTHQTDPQDFIVSTANGNLTASLKKF